MVTLKKVYRLTIFVPPEHLEKVLNGVMGVVPLVYGKYDQVAWRSSPGIEQFRPLPGSHPTEGSEHSLSRGDSVKLEFSIARNKALLRKVVKKGVLPNHPWEEPVIVIVKAVETRVHPEN